MRGLRARGPPKGLEPFLGTRTRRQGGAREVLLVGWSQQATLHPLSPRKLVLEPGRGDQRTYRHFPAVFPTLGHRRRDLRDLI